MSDSKENAVTGYIVAVVAMAPFFWLVLGDAYGRFKIVFDPTKSIMSYYLEPYTSAMTGLVCLAAPLLLAYVLRAVVERWVDTAWDLSARGSDWLYVNGKKLAVLAWWQLSNVASTLWKTVSGRFNGHRQ